MGRTHRNYGVSFCQHCKKLAHQDQHSACTHRRKLVETGKHRVKHGRLNVYRCPHGNGWHVGHSA